VKAEAAAAIPAGFEDVTFKADASAARPTITEKTLPAAPAEAESTTITSPTAAPAAETAEDADASATGGESADKLERAAKAAKDAKAAAKHNRQLREEKQRLEQTAEFAHQKVQALESQVNDLQSWMQALRTNPLEAMKALGITPQQVAEKIARDGSPEAQIEELREQIARQQQEFERQQAMAQREQMRARAAQVENDFKTESQNAKKYPNIAGAIHPDFILARSKELITELRRKGYDPKQFSNHDLLSYLDSYYSKSNSPQKDSETSTGKPESKPAHGKTKTITNRLQTASHTAPPDFNKLNDREQRKAMAAQLAALMKQ
jgi:hypothetical protein